MEHYDHMRTVRAITDFVAEDLSNWYIRRARSRFYAEEMTEDKKSVYATTYEVLVGVAKLIAPIAPFISDEMYTKLTGEESVHLAYFPKAKEELINKSVEERMDLVRDLVALGRGTREKERIKVRQPLSEILVDGKYESLISDLTPLIMEELNVKQVVFEKELDQYMNYSLKPNFKVAGPILGKRYQSLWRRFGQGGRGGYGGGYSWKRNGKNYTGTEWRADRDYHGYGGHAHQRQRGIQQWPWKTTSLRFWTQR